MRPRDAVLLAALVAAGSCDPGTGAAREDGFSATMIVPTIRCRLLETLGARTTLRAGDATHAELVAPDGRIAARLEHVDGLVLVRTPAGDPVAWVHRDGHVAAVDVDCPMTLAFAAPSADGSSALTAEGRVLSRIGSRAEAWIGKRP